MDEASGPDSRADHHPTHEVFRTVGNETRLQVLHALWEAYDPATGPTPLSFSALRDAVDVADSGRFNYHLGKLTGPFISKRDGEYELTNAGLSLIQTIIGGAAIDETALDPTETDLPCHYCGAPTVIEYDDEFARISCSECSGTWEDGTLGSVRFPPAGLRERTPTEISQAAYRWNLHRFESLLGGVCPQCAGTTTILTDVCPDHEREPEGRCGTCQRRDGNVFTAVCGTCKYAHRGPFRMAVLSHQAVAAFLSEHGVAFDYGSFEAFLTSHGFGERVVAEDPLRVEISIPAGGEALRLVVDGDLNVVSTVREPAP